jgi:hypothetical protein
MENLKKKQIFKYIKDATTEGNDFLIGVFINQAEYKEQKVWSIRVKCRLIYAF